MVSAWGALELVGELVWRGGEGDVEVDVMEV